VPNKHFAADCPSSVFIEGVQPAKLVKNGGNCAGKVGVESKLGLYSNLEYKLGFRRAAAENER
jgi:hypothetical protein